MCVFWFVTSNHFINLANLHFKFPLSHSIRTLYHACILLNASITLQGTSRGSLFTLMRQIMNISAIMYHEHLRRYWKLSSLCLKCYCQFMYNCECQKERHHHKNMGNSSSHTPLKLIFFKKKKKKLMWDNHGTIHAIYLATIKPFWVLQIVPRFSCLYERAFNNPNASENMRVLGTHISTLCRIKLHHITG